MKIFPKDEGSLVFWIGHENQNWTQDNNFYTFFPDVDLGLTLFLVKLPDKNLLFFMDAPLMRTFFAKADISEERDNKMMIGLTWKGPEIAFYINAKLKVKQEVKEEDRVELQVRLETDLAPLVLSKLGIILLNLNTLLTSTDSIIFIPDGESILIGMNNGWGRDKIQVFGFSEGSLKWRLNVPKKVWDFVAKNFHALLSIANGHAKRLAEAYTAKREAEAFRAIELARQEQIKTQNEALDLYKRIEDDLARLKPELTPEQRMEIFTKGIADPIRNLSDTLVSNGYRLTIEQE